MLLSDVQSSAGDVIQCVVWNDLCPFTYYHVNVDDLVLICGAKLRAKEIELTPKISIELSLNPSHPKGILQKISTKLLSESHLQGLDETFRPLYLISEKYIYKSDGILTYVSPIQRESSFPPSTEAAVVRKFSQFRWIKVINSEKGEEKNVKIYAGSNPDKLADLQPNQYISLYFLRPIEGPSKNTYTFTTSYYSQWISSQLPSINQLMMLQGGLFVPNLPLSSPATFNENSLPPLMTLKDIVGQFGKMEFGEIFFVRTARAALLEAHIPSALLNKKLRNNSKKKEIHFLSEMEVISFPVSEQIDLVDEYRTAEESTVTFSVQLNGVLSLQKVPFIELHIVDFSHLSLKENSKKKVKPAKMKNTVGALESSEALSVVVKVFPKLLYMNISLITSLKQFESAMFKQIVFDLLQYLGLDRCYPMPSTEELSLENILGLLSHLKGEFILMLSKESNTNCQLILVGFHHQ